MEAFEKVSDSGERQEFQTGSVRDTRKGKGRFDLLPCYALTRLAQHYENGTVKYGDRNWEKGQNLSRYLDSAIRHLIKYLGGSREEDHLAAVAWNALAYIETEYRIKMGMLPKELNDMEGVGVQVNKQDEPPLRIHHIHPENKSITDCGIEVGCYRNQYYNNGWRGVTCPECYKNKIIDDLDNL